MEITVPKLTTILWQLRLGTILILLDALVASFTVFTLWMLLPIAIMLTLEAAFLFVYLPKFFGGYKIEIKDGSILVHYGVFIKSTRIMPYARMVYTGSYATPISKRRGLMGISLRAARGVLFLPEIEKEKALSIIETVSEGLK